jgi:hypothetical protein
VQLFGEVAAGSPGLDSGERPVDAFHGRHDAVDPLAGWQVEHRRHRFDRAIDLSAREARGERS